MTDTREPRPGGDVVVYEAPDGEVALDVRLEQETVWLTQRQMADVFRTSLDNISLHLKNVFADRELDRAATTEDFSVVRPEGNRRVRRRIRHYNLDAIISVGYRVNSKRAVRFRQWATRTLREHLVNGYTLNQRRLAEHGLQEARETLHLLARTLRNQDLVEDTGRAVLELVTRYADTWRLLLLFLLYLRQEGLNHDLNPQALTALTLLIAESAPANKDLLIRLMVHLLAGPEV